MFANTLHICNELQSFSNTVEPRDNDNQTVKALKFLRKKLGNMANLRGLKSRLLNDDDPDYLVNNGYLFTYKTIFPKVGQWLQLTNPEFGGLAIDGPDLVDSLAKGLPNLQRPDLAIIDLPDGLW